jgi:hypothetical protein
MRAFGGFSNISRALSFDHTRIFFITPSIFKYMTFRRSKLVPSNHQHSRNGGSIILVRGHGIPLGYLPRSNKSWGKLNLHKGYLTRHYTKLYQTLDQMGGYSCAKHHIFSNKMPTRMKRRTWACCFPVDAHSHTCLPSLMMLHITSLSNESLGKALTSRAIKRSQTRTQNHPHA